MCREYGLIDRLCSRMRFKAVGGVYGSLRCVDSSLVVQDVLSVTTWYLLVLW